MRRVCSVYDDYRLRDVLARAIFYRANGNDVSSSPSRGVSRSSEPARESLRDAREVRVVAPRHRLPHRFVPARVGVPGRDVYAHDVYAAVAHDAGGVSGGGGVSAVSAGVSGVADEGACRRRRG